MTKSISAIIIIACAAIVILWDFYAYFTGGTHVTVSKVVWDWSKSNPILPFGTGVICGHLFWPGKK